MIYEIRNYHFDPNRLDAYRSWAEKEAIPYLSGKMDVVGFWITTSDETELLGNPHDELGIANVTWIIRWQDVEERHEQMPAVLSEPEWQDIFTRVPGGAESYRRIEVKFADALV